MRNIFRPEYFFTCSYYEIIISATQKNKLPIQLANQRESELKNTDYFIAATVKADDFPTDGVSYTFVDSKEYIDGLNARISTIGKYYFYARAVINGNVRIHVSLLYPRII